MIGCPSEADLKTWFVFLVDPLDGLVNGSSAFSSRRMLVQNVFFRTDLASCLLFGVVFKFFMHPI